MEFLGALSSRTAVYVSWCVYICGGGGWSVHDWAGHASAPHAVAVLTWAKVGMLSLASVTTTMK